MGIRGVTDRCPECNDETPYIDTYIIDKQEHVMCFVCAGDILMEEWLVSQGEILYDKESERWVQSSFEEREALIEEAKN